MTALAKLSFLRCRGEFQMIKMDQALIMFFENLPTDFDKENRRKYTDIINNFIVSLLLASRHLKLKKLGKEKHTTLEKEIDRSKNYCESKSTIWKDIGEVMESIKRKTERINTIISNKNTSFSCSDLPKVSLYIFENKEKLENLTKQFSLDFCIYNVLFNWYSNLQYRSDEDKVLTPNSFEYVQYLVRIIDDNIKISPRIIDSIKKELASHIVTMQNLSCSKSELAKIFIKFTNTLRSLIEGTYTSKIVFGVDKIKKITKIGLKKVPKK
jgi:hypothetical protein